MVIEIPDLPDFFFHIQEDVLIEYFSLSSEDIKLIQRLRSDKNKLGLSVLLRNFIAPQPTPAWR